MHKAVDEMGVQETFRGYGPEQGYDFLRVAVQDYYKKHKDVIQNVNMNSSSSYNGFQVNVNWTDLPVESFLQMTNTNNGRERDRFFKNNPGLKQKILNSYRQKILSSCPNISRKDLLNVANFFVI